MADETKNVVVQLNKQATDNLAATAAISYDGDPLEPEEKAALTSWYELTFFGSPFKSGANGTTRIEDWLIQVDCYAEADEAGVNRVWELVDAAYAGFDRQTISVLDWSVAGGGSAVAQIQTLEMTWDRVPPGPADRELMRVACTVPMVIVDV